MAQIVVEKKQSRLEKWAKKNKEELTFVACMAAYLLVGYEVGKFTERSACNTRFQMARGDGFVKLFDPNTGEEVKYTDYVKLIKSFYKR